MKTGILILNIGTPRTPTTPDVARYLKRFLMDEAILPLPRWARWMLVYGLIVPFRASKSAAKYAKIWTPEGSPLKVHTEKFVQKLTDTLTVVSSQTYIVEIGLAFSEPEIDAALDRLLAEKIDRLLLAPMFPQFSVATTGSILKDVRGLLRKKKSDVQMTELKPFYDQAAFINNLADNCRRTMSSGGLRPAGSHAGLEYAGGKVEPTSQAVDHWVFSFHGLPEKQVTSNAGCELNESCCASQSSCTQTCYRSQSYKTSHYLAHRLGLTRDQWTMCFQSRLGREEWLKPYTNDVLQNFAGKNIAVVCPSFVVDCLETLEEINIEGREVFRAAGGRDFRYVPCLNEQDQWVEDFGRLLVQTVGNGPR